MEIAIRSFPHLPMLIPVFLTCYRRTFLGAFLALWCVGLAMGAQALWNYSSTPGTAGAAPERWPANAPFQPRPGRATLVMLAHPHCPCTRASLAELAQIMTHGEADAWVLFIRPEGAEPGWEHSNSWEAAAEIPGAHILVDADGTVAKAFGAETSGHVLFYDAAGILRFSGGVTASRGERGPSAGGEAILTALRGGSGSAPSHALTYGCPLLTVENSP